MLGVKAHPFISYFNNKTVVPERRFRDVLNTCEPFKRKPFPLKMEYGANLITERSSSIKSLVAVQAVSSGVRDIQVSSSSEDFTVTASSADKPDELKISIEVSRTKTQEIFDEVLSKIAGAQPIPGFRRVKGGKTPNIPKDILLEILGPSKVYEQVIKKIINSTIQEYVSKERLRVCKDLQVEQSFEDLEAGFEPGDKFRFDAILQCQKSD